MALRESIPSSIFMLQEMAAIEEIADSIRIAKVHPQLDAGIFKSAAIIVRNVYRIAEKRLVHNPALIIDQHEMQLMNVKCMQFV